MVYLYIYFKERIIGRSELYIKDSNLMPLHMIHHPLIEVPFFLFTFFSFIFLGTNICLSRKALYINSFYFYPFLSFFFYSQLNNTIFLQIRKKKGTEKVGFLYGRGFCHILSRRRNTCNARTLSFFIAKYRNIRPFTFHHFYFIAFYSTFHSPPLLFPRGQFFLFFIFVCCNEVELLGYVRV